MNDKSKNSFHGLHSRKTLVFVSLLFMITLASSCLVSVFSSVTPFVHGASDKVVSNETELRDAINNASNKKSFTIALNNDISLTNPSLTIPTDKDITLTSNKAIGYYKLIGRYESTLTVENGGVLKLDGVIITHESDRQGRGVTVNSGGTLVMHCGEISGNSAPMILNAFVGGPWSEGGGVHNSGVFELYGGKISNNTAQNGYGGGVYNRGTFKMFDGEISNNKAPYSPTTSDDGRGGGVCNYGTFEMYGGKIFNNYAAFTDGGVYGTFNWFGGTIFDNKHDAMDVYPEGSGSLGGDDGTSNGNGGSSGGNGGTSNGNNGTSPDNGGGSFGGGFSLRDVVIICVGVVGLTAVVITVSLFSFFGRRMKQVEEKMNIQSKEQIFVLTFCSEYLDNVFNVSINCIFKRLLV